MHFQTNLLLLKRPHLHTFQRALANLARSVPFELSVSLHSQGEEIYYFPFLENNISEGNCAKDPIARQYRVAKRCAVVLSKELGYKISKPEGTACYGGFSDFTAGELMIPSLTVEIGRGKNPLPASEYIKIKERFVKAMVSLVLTLA